MKTSLEMAVTSEKTTLSNPAPHNPNYTDIPKEHFRVNLPWDYSIRLGFQFDKEFAKVFTDGEDIILSANRQEFKFWGYAKLYFYKENGNPKSTDVDEHYDSQFITLPKKDFANFNVGDTINIEYVDPAPLNAVWLHGIDKNTVLEGERHLRLSKGETNGLDTTDNPTNGQIQEVDGERHSTI